MELASWGEGPSLATQRVPACHTEYKAHTPHTGPRAFPSHRGAAPRTWPDTDPAVHHCLQQQEEM